MSINCLNKSLPAVKELIAIYGEGRVEAAWRNNNEQVPTVEQAAILLGEADDYLLKTNADQDGKLTGIEFSTEGEIKSAYAGDTRTAVNMVISDPRVLHLFPDGRFIKMGESLLSGEQKISFLANSWNANTNSSSFKDSMGRTLEELFSSYKRGEPTSPLSISYHIASRLLNPTNNFSGRVAAGLHEKGKVDINYVRLINNPSEKSTAFYADGKGIVINSAAILEWMNLFSDYEAFVKGTDIALSEEAIHLAARSVVSDSEVMQVYNELDDSEKERVRTIYGDPTLDREPLAHEYIRMFLQQEIFGTTTELQLRATPTVITILKKLLNELLDIFRGNKTRVSNEIIDRVRIAIKEAENTIGRTNYTQLSSDTTQSADPYITNRIRKFIESLGGRIIYSGQIVINGKVIPASAVADVINRTIQIADGKESIDTLPEEAAHIYVHWLPKNSQLYRDMLAGIITTPEYRKTLAQYRNNPLYQKADGTTDIDKIAVEAIGKVIAGHIVGQNKDAKSKKWWQRLWEIIKNLFRGKNLDSYETAASDILSNRTGKLDMKAVKEAQDNGRYYLQLSAEDERFYRAIERSASPAQKAVINDLVRNPSVVLIEATHQYVGTATDDTTAYTSVTTAIGTEFTGDSTLYEANRQWGNDADKILKGIVEGRVLSDIEPTDNLSEQVRKDIYVSMSDYINSYLAQGYVALTQVAVADRASGIAGTIDLLLVSPGGALKVIDLKTSWNSVRGHSYTDMNRQLRAESKIRTPERTHINKRQQHAIQVGTYTKILQVMGYQRVQEPVTKNYLVNAQNGIVTSFTNEGEVIHKPTKMQVAVDLIVPTKVTDKNRLDELGVENVVNSKEYKEEIEKAAEEEQNAPKVLYTPENLEELKDKNVDILIALVNYRKALEQEAQSRNIANRVVRDQKIEELNRVIADIVDESGKGNIAASYMRFLDYVEKGVNSTITYIGDRKNYEDPKYAGKVALAQAFLRQMQTVVTTVENAIKRDPVAVSKAIDVLNSIQQAQEVLSEADKNIVKYQIIVPNTSRELTEQALAESVLKWEDITDLDTKFSDIDNSGNPILENLAKKIKLKLEQSRVLAEAQKERLVKAAEKLRIATGSKSLTNAVGATITKMYDPLWQVYPKGHKLAGQRTGRMISQAGQVYWDIYDGIWNNLLDSHGNWKEYIEKPKTPEDIAFNQDLWYAKQERKQFEAGEYVDYDPYTDVTDYREQGDYHYYDPEFVGERNIYQRLYKGKWIPKADMKGTAEYEQFIKKYYTFVPQYWKMEVVKGVPTGKVSLNPLGEYFVNRQYLRVRDKASDGTLLSDPVYNRLQAAKKGTADAALWEFYTEYRNIIAEEIEKLPASSQIWYQKGYIPTIRSNYMQQVSRDGTDIMKLTMSELKETFSVNAYTHQHDIDKMGGSLSQSLPIMYTASLRNQQVVQNLDKEIADHIAAKHLAVTGQQKKVWKDKLNELNDLRMKELNKMSGDEIHPDLAIGAIRFIDMANGFSVHDDIKDEVAAVRNVISQMTFYEDKTDFYGNVIKRKEVNGEESNTFKRLSGWIQMIYEHDDSVGKSTIEVLTRKAMKVSSALGISFNLVGHANNAIMGKINNNIASYGDELFDTRANIRMIKEQNLAVAAIAKDISIGKQTYLKKKPSSKFQALAERFNMVELRNDNDPGKIELFGKLGYGTMEGGEWLVQTRVGNNVLDSIQLTALNGDTVSVYDAFEFSNGELSIKDGYTLPDGKAFTREEEHKITNRIRETNKAIHGNYRAIDRAMMERHWYGQLIMQYHKWVYPAFRARFQKGKFNENLGGGMWLEGRWRSVLPFVRGIREGSQSLNVLWMGTFKDTSKMTKDEKAQWLQEVWGGTLTLEEYNSLSPEEQVKLMNHRRNNIKKNIMDLLYLCVLFAAFHLLKGLAEGLDDDDPYMRKFANWMMWQADRTESEIAFTVPILNLVEGYKFVKNPAAVLTTIADFGQLVNASVEYPFASDKERILQRGPHKGDLKVHKEFTDILPIYKQYNRIVAFDNVSQFFIR